MEVGTVIICAVAFLAGLIVGRVWGGASARHDGNMLSTRPAAPAVPTRAASYSPPNTLVEEPDALLEEEVRRLVASGKLINAIKFYRERKGCGLKEAKDAVERISR